MVGSNSVIRQTRRVRWFYLFQNKQRSDARGGKQIRDEENRDRLAEAKEIQLGEEKWHHVERKSRRSVFRRKWIGSRRDLGGAMMDCVYSHVCLQLFSFVSVLFSSNVATMFFSPYGRASFSFFSLVFITSILNFPPACLHKAECMDHRYLLICF